MYSLEEVPLPGPAAVSQSGGVRGLADQEVGVEPLDVCSPKVPVGRSVVVA